MQELVFDLPHYRIRGRRYQSKTDAPKVIAVHGWLDNCGSFTKLASHLPTVDLVTLDLVGNGLSDHRSADSEYSIWSDVADVIAVADKLNWSQFYVVGHSRGAALATLVAGTYPERVLGITLIDGGVPLMGHSNQAANQLRKAIDRKLAYEAKPSRVYESFEQAVDVRAKGMWPLSLEASASLAERGMKQVDNGWQWQSDRRLNLPSEVRLSFNQVKSFIEAIRVDSTVILASEGVMARYPEMRQALEQFDHFNLVSVDGSHHLHMEAKSCEQVAKHILRQVMAALPQ